MKVVYPKISVIIPVYNVEQYLPKCIESIINQNFTDFELLLIDDGSKDSSGNICDEFAKNDSRIQVFHKKNGGVSAARNLGIEMSRGEWICFVDSDDWLDIEAFGDIIKNIKNINVDLVIWGIKLAYTNYIEILTLPIVGFFDNKTEIDEILIRIDMSGLLESPCNKLYSSRLIKENQNYFDTNLSQLEDIKFNCNCFKNILSVFVIDKPFYNYRKDGNPNSLSSLYPDNLLGIVEESINMRVDFFSSYSGVYRNKYLVFLESKIENIYLVLNLSMYADGVVSKKRKDAWRTFLDRGNIYVFKGALIYNIFKTNNVFFIDNIFKIRYLIISFFPFLLTVLRRFANKHK